MGVTNGEREGIRRVILGKFRQGEKRFYHALDLDFFRHAIATNCHFDAPRFIFVNRLARGGRRHNYCATSLAQNQHRIGLLPDILNTVYLVFAAVVVVLPTGIGTAVFLTEYARKGRLVSFIEYAVETLSGIPSIIFGLVGMLIFCQILGFKTSLLAGALTLAVMTLPVIIRTTQESLKAVPDAYREGAFGLGAGKWRVIRTVVLPCCTDGIATGCILAIGRMLGESAALLFTAGFAHNVNGFIEGLSAPGASLAVALYVYAKEQGEFEVAFVAAFILLTMSFLINLAAGHFASRVDCKVGQ